MEKRTIEKIMELAEAALEEKGFEAETFETLCGEMMTPDEVRSVRNFFFNVQK